MNCAIARSAEIEMERQGKLVHSFLNDEEKKEMGPFEDEVWYACS